MVSEDCCRSNGVVTSLSCAPPPQQSEQPFRHIPPRFSLCNILSSPSSLHPCCHLPLPLTPWCISLPYFWLLPVSPRFSHVIASAFSCVLCLAGKFVPLLLLGRKQLVMRLLGVVCVLSVCQLEKFCKKVGAEQFPVMPVSPCGSV